LKHHLIIDFSNFARRAYGMGVSAGEHGLLWSFFRTLRPLVESVTLPEDEVVLHFTIDGRPVRRKAIYPEYKGNRAKAREASEKSREAEAEFRRQSPLVKAALLELLPCYIYESPVLEADDLMFDLATRLSHEDYDMGEKSDIRSITVITADQDLLQLSGLPSVDVYDPRRKKLLEYPKYDVATYKTFAGDKSDNIPPIPGYGPSSAAKVAAMDDMQLQALYETFTPEQSEALKRNNQLVQLDCLNVEERQTVVISQGPEKCEWMKFAKFMHERQLQSLVTDVKRTMAVYKRCSLKSITPQ